jgi:hypothetical protein
LNPHAFVSGPDPPVSLLGLPLYLVSMGLWAGARRLPAMRNCLKSFTLYAAQSFENDRVIIGEQDRRVFHPTPLCQRHKHIHDRPDSGL